MPDLLVGGIISSEHPLHIDPRIGDVAESVLLRCVMRLTCAARWHGAVRHALRPSNTRPCTQPTNGATDAPQRMLARCMFEPMLARGVLAGLRWCCFTSVEAVGDSVMRCDAGCSFGAGTVTFHTHCVTIATQPGAYQGHRGVVAVGNVLDIAVVVVAGVGFAGRRGGLAAHSALGWE